MSLCLRQEFLHHRSVDIRQPEIAPLIAVGQLGVIHAQAVQQRRIQVVHVDRILGDVVAVVVGLAVANARP